MPPKDDIVAKIKEDPDYVDLKRFNYSLKEAMARYPDGVPDRIIASGLRMSLEELNQTYANIVKKLRIAMKVDDE